MFKAKKTIYLDHAATTYLDPKVVSAMKPFWEKEYGNPSSLYAKGMEAKFAIDDARKKIAELIGARENEIIFTAGGTESCNLAIFGAVHVAKQKVKKPHIICSAIEHHAVLECFRALEKEGVEVTYLPVDGQGFVNVKELLAAVKTNTVFVSIICANNEIGTVEPIAEIAKQLHKKNHQIVFHTDACVTYNMQYAFILGRVYTLSIAELIEVLKSNGIEFKILIASIEVVIIETEQQLDFEKLQKQLGGIIKIAKIIDFIKKRDRDSINFALQNYFKPSKLKKDYFKEYSGKKQFGLSIYLLDPSIKAFGEPRKLGMFIKKGLQDEGASLRACLPEFNSLALASVVVTKNLLLQKGAEIIVVAGIDRVYVGKTLVVQDFEDYGRRDYQRPVRDEKVGMIPPKVAQIMINFARTPKNGIILDPFCGMGSIIQEAVLQGFKTYGSDIAKFAISASEKNLEWFRNRYKVPPGKYRLELADVAKVSEAFKGEKIATIVTEGFLGPMYGQMPKQAEIDKNFEDLKKLWTTAFKEFKNLLPKGARAVICLPAYKKQLVPKGEGEYIMFPSVDFIEKLGYSIEDKFPEQVKKIMPFLKVTERNSMIYDRKDQTVAREIITFINN